ncbi:hypothetical protein F5887DRAFT_534170 [Amanita rubescens]|nr:hypothetical protein F5887DRAFT_534170 [Amanita rubescens]
MRVYVPNSPKDQMADEVRTQLDYKNLGNVLRQQQCWPLRPYKLVLSPNRIMQLFTPPNILFVLLFAFFARSSPIDDNAKTVSDLLIESNSNRLPSKQRLVQQGASFLDLDPEPKPPGGPVIKSFGTKNIPSQNAQPPAGKLPPIPETSTKPLSRDDIQKKIAALT